MVLKGEKPLDTLPSKLRPPADFDAIVEKLRKINPAAGLRQAIAYCLYPQVVEDFLAGYETYGDISQMPSDIFFYGMDRGESMEMSIEEGKTLMIKYIGPGERNDDGTLELQFEPVSYTHLDVYKRQILPMARSGMTASISTRSRRVTCAAVWALCSRM